MRLMTTKVFGASCVMVISMIVWPAVGQCELDKLLGTDTSILDRFGVSVSISGPTGKEVVIIGADGDIDNGYYSAGSAYIFRRSGTSWIQEVKFLASDGSAQDYFGQSVSICGISGNEVALVGAPGDGHFSGSAYIYRRSGGAWIEEAKLLAYDGAIYHYFGQSVSMIGCPENAVAIVGANGNNNHNGYHAGAAYIFRFNQQTSEWIQEARLIASDGAAHDNFGFDVKIIGAFGQEVVIVGARGSYANVFYPGAAYIFRRDADTSEWIEEAKLLASDGAGFDSFGSKVSIIGTSGHEVAIVSSPQGDDSGIASGSAYIFRNQGEASGWIEEAKLVSSDGTNGDVFGFSVAISGGSGNEIAVVGAFSDSDIRSSSGSVYLYRFNGVDWIEQVEFYASDAAYFRTSHFGNSISVNGTPGNEIAIIGAYRQGTSAGSAYIFGLGSAVCCPGDLNGDGFVDVFDLFRVIHALFTRGDVAEDLDGDGVVTFRDVHIVIQSFGSCDDSNPETCPADLNGDGIVDVPDLLLLLGSWGLCPAPCPSDLNGDGAVNVSDFLELLAAWGPCP